MCSVPSDVDLLESYMSKRPNTSALGIGMSIISEKTATHPNQSNQISHRSMATSGYNNFTPLMPQ
jgi:hypothetical protein